MPFSHLLRAARSSSFDIVGIIKSYIIISGVKDVIMNFLVSGVFILGIKIQPCTLSNTSTFHLHLLNDLSCNTMTWGENSSVTM